MDDRTEVDQLRWALERQLGWIQSAETKLTILVPVPTAMLGVLLASIDRLGQSTWRETFPFVVSAALLLLSLCFSAFSVVPRTDGPASSIFFGRIAQATLQEFRDRVASRSEADYVMDLVSQVHINAEIATKKHVLVRQAMYCMFAAIPPWLAALYFI